MTPQSIFSQFTNLYSLSKTLKFELKPTETTKAFLNFDNDKARGVSYKEMKIMFDELHRDFISEALSNVDLDFTEFLEFYKKFLVARKNSTVDLKKWEEKKKEMEKEMENKLKEYRKKIVKQFNLYGEQFKLRWNNQLNQKPRLEWKGKKEYKDKVWLKSAGYKALTDSGILEVLKLLNPDKIKIISEFDNFFTYFTSFNQTRENLYKDDGKVTAIATRLIDENLLRFCDNIIYWEELKKTNKDGNQIIFEGIDESFFEIGYYNQCLNQIGINIYNGTKESEDAQTSSLSHNRTKINKQLQLFWGDNKKYKGLKFKDLYKVMLTESVAFMKDYDEVEILDRLKEMSDRFEKSLPLVKDLITNLSGFELEKILILEKIWIKNTAISKLSASFCGGNNWNLIGNILNQLDSGKIVKGELKLNTFIRLSAIKEAFDRLATGDNIQIKKLKKGQIATSVQYTAKDIFNSVFFGDNQLLESLENSSNLWSCFIILLQNEWNKELAIYNQFKPIVKNNINDKYEPTKEVEYTESGAKLTQSNLVKKYIDPIQNMWNLVRVFQLFHNKKSVESQYETDTNFYNSLNTFLNEFSAFGYYNDLRNFSTKKPFSTQKFKVNFENSTLLGGWDVNKERDNTSIILKTGSIYELIVLDKKHNKLFDRKASSLMYSDTNSNTMKMEYKLLKGVALSIPKCATQLKKVITHFKDSSDDYILVDKKIFNAALIITKSEFEINNRIYSKTNISESVVRSKQSDTDEKSYIKAFQKDFVKLGGSEKLYKEKVIEWIIFCKKFLKCYKSCDFFDFSKLKPAEIYGNVDEFYKDVDSYCYKLKFVPVDNNLIQKYEQEGKLFRFQIKNKDWNEGSKGAKNLQTIYWESLFSQDNLNQTNLKLNGEAEIFQRPASDSLKKESIVTKHKHFEIKNAYHNKRYLEEGGKMLLHVPITINFASQEITKFNDYTTNSLNKNKTSYLGIDRGENNLLYYVLIDSNGRIIDQKSLNKLGSIDPRTGKPKDYADLLQKKQEERKLAKETWSVINNIKNLKEGYLSLAIHEICKIAFESNALIVLESLNFGFKKSRTIKFEKSVYQKFEVKLATKLQHLFFKDKESNELGGVLNALQLCPPFDNSKMENALEWGIVSYVPAAYTSRIDPMTGWRKHIYLQDKVEDIKQKFNLEANYTEESNSRTSNSSIKIIWKGDLKCFGFEYTHKDLKVNKSQAWQVLAHKDLVRNGYDSTQNQYENRTTVRTGAEIHEDLEKILGQYKSKTDGSFNQEEMLEGLLDSQWLKLKVLYDLITNIRVKKDLKTGKIDAIQSPILCTPDNCIFSRDNNNFEPFFFDTRQSLEINKNLKTTVPINADANGAYHIALTKYLKPL